MSNAPVSQRQIEGMATRRAVLGDPWVDKAEANRTPFDAPFQEMLTETAWSHVWSRDTITKRERSMLTLAILASLGHHEELALHTRATVNTGASPDDIREALLHVAVYAGIPAANTAFRIVKEELRKLDVDVGGKP
jgi:4-carboxymuconolactone decarboxylase